VQRKLFVAVEDWTCDFEPNRYQRIVTLKNGTVAYIRTGSYGYSENAKSEKRECREQTVARGDSKSDVVEICGGPNWKDTHEKEFVKRPNAGVERKRYVTVDKWTYDLGPNRFVLILTFRKVSLSTSRPAVIAMMRSRNKLEVFSLRDLAEKSSAVSS
jgi:uncharacterized protein DUF2845